MVILNSIFILQICFIFAVLAVQIVHSKRLDPGPQTFPEQISATQNSQKRYTTKEIVVYLTPSQISALREGRGYIDALTTDQAETSEGNQEESEESLQEQEDNFQSFVEASEELEKENDEIPSLIPAVDSNLEEVKEDPQFSLVYNQPQDRKFVPSPEDNYAYLSFYPESETQTEENRLESEESEEEPEEAQPESLPETQSETPQLQLFKLVRYESDTVKSTPTTTKAPQQKSPKERRLLVLKKNRSQLRKASLVQGKTTTSVEQPQTEPETILSKLRFSARYSNQRQTTENDDKRRKNILEKQKALIQAEARNKNAPVVDRKELKVTKYQQTPSIKRVKVPTPVLVPLNELIKVKVPRPFPVPLEINKPIFAQTAKDKKVEVEDTSAPARTECTYAPETLSTAADKASLEDRRRLAEARKEISIDVPSRKPKKVTIIRHVWEKK
ncbi:unnamed protein product [Parnassius apollo]|uniref:(apollo) hypothetical protein n=1 Tax=Parnassius apollo TaxID=110799 RepID=A0A8S3X1J2_PARAO|nr:unnamed protein product [Parnassius apollo]